MKKIAVTSEGPSLDDRVDPRFGRAAGFVIVDLETMDSHYLDNGRSQVLAQGAGIQAAEMIARAGVDFLLTGYVGPKAFQALSAAGVQVGQNLEGLTVREAIERFRSGQVEVAEAANREAHR
jgi:predicted Fe-Mo cluster-binding NifX family protein